MKRSNFANDKLGKKVDLILMMMWINHSSNDTFPTALHIACLDVIDRKPLPSMKDLICAFKTFEKENEDIIK